MTEPKEIRDIGISHKELSALSKNGLGYTSLMSVLERPIILSLPEKRESRGLTSEWDSDLATEGKMSISYRKLQIASDLAPYVYGVMFGKTNRELKIICAADSTSGDRWFPTSVNDGEWLEINSKMDTLIRDGPINAYTEEMSITCHNGIKFCVEYGIMEPCTCIVQIKLDADLLNLVYWEPLIMPLSGSKVKYDYWGDDTWVFCNVPSHQIQDFIHAQGGEATGPLVINGFFAASLVEIEEWEGQTGMFDIEL